MENIASLKHRIVKKKQTSPTPTTRRLTFRVSPPFGLLALCCYTKCIYLIWELLPPRYFSNHHFIKRVQYFEYVIRFPQVIFLNIISQKECNNLNTLNTFAATSITNARLCIYMGCEKALQIIQVQLTNARPK